MTQHVTPEARGFFERSFRALTGYDAMRWQSRLFIEHFQEGNLPDSVSIPTGLGKTAVMAVWLIAFAWQVRAGSKPKLPRRLVYVVDRRAVVDQSTSFAERLRENLEKPEAAELRSALGSLIDRKLAISTLRGQFVDDREWLEDPSQLAIIVGTVDMSGSRLLFEGYGVSRKMRPYHAGLLGADALVLLDEAHLVQPFEALLAEIAGNADNRYGESVGAQHAALPHSSIIPKFQLLPLSATGRRRTATPFSLQEKDFREDGKIVDAETYERLSAKKHLTLQELGEKKLENALAEQAWALSGAGTQPVRVIVFCDERKVAESVKGALEKLAKDESVRERIELFVGARRVRERTKAQTDLQALGFLAGEGGKQTQPSFLVATSAGEVGVDLDADHMTCDLVTWERMVQRFGRVNRRGGEGRQARIVVVLIPEPKPPELKADADEKARKRHEAMLEKHKKEVEAGRKTKKPFREGLNKGGDEGLFDVSSEALWRLNETARTDEALAKLIADASTQPLLRPALNRALVDAWAMTSLPEHTGRPEVAPWLRGWVDEQPQTAVAWRKYLPVRSGTPASKKEIEDFFEAAPLHVSETLETESWRVMKWLKERAAKLDKIPDADKKLKENDVVAMLLKMDGSLVGSIKLGDLLGDAKNKNDKKILEEIERDIRGKSLVVDARFGGLQSGLLKNDVNDAPVTADDTNDNNKWTESSDGKPVIRFRILERGEESDEVREKDWRESLRFDLERRVDGEATRWLSVQKWRDSSNNENDRSISRRSQSLVEHQSWAAKRAEDMGKRLRLPDDYVCALSIAARLHDEGKNGRNWKRAAFVESYARKLGTPGQSLAKTPKFNWRLLEGYRHEFGSLPYAKDDPEFKKLQEQNADLAELVLHLIAAHHGYARPLISTDGCEDAPPSALEDRAREVALRYARLQRRWGPWGLAWWESLLRAADAQASRANDEREDA